MALVEVCDTHINGVLCGDSDVSIIWFATTWKKLREGNMHFEISLSEDVQSHVHTVVEGMQSGEKQDSLLF